MSPNQIATFEGALKAADKKKRKNKPHLLVGNGFSRACKDNIFSYDALFEQAHFEGIAEDAKMAFRALGTTDFEQVMRCLSQAAQLLHAYNQPSLAATLADQAAALREVLVRTIAENHPARPQDISRKQYAACRQFLSHFQSIYTVNYDLLLYWTLMQDEIEPILMCDDGFRQPYTGEEKYVSWEVENTDTQCIHYLHGALHIFDAGAVLQKFTWSNTKIALIEQIREALANDRFPLFVSEGSAQDKLNRIQHSGYLNRSYRSFAKIGGPLFIFGLSMSQQDEHLLRLLDQTKCDPICVGIYGKPSSSSNKRIIDRSKNFGARRKNKPSLIYYDATSAHVWDA